MQNSKLTVDIIIEIAYTINTVLLFTMGMFRIRQGVVRQYKHTAGSAALKRKIKLNAKTNNQMAIAA